MTHRKDWTGMYRGVEMDHAPVAHIEHSHATVLSLLAERDQLREEKRELVEALRDMLNLMREGDFSVAFTDAPRVFRAKNLARVNAKEKI